jgi:hypothetical protein
MTSPLVERARALTDADQVEAFLGELEAARIVAAAKLTQPAATVAPVADDPVTLTQAATLLDASVRWVREHARELGGRQIGRKLVFSRRALLGASK